MVTCLLLPLRRFNLKRAHRRARLSHVNLRFSATIDVVANRKPANYRPFKTVRSGGFAEGDIAWFPEGGLNMSYNAVDRWAYTDPDRVAIIYEADEPDGGCSMTYPELLRQVCSLANVLSSTFGVKPGDTVSIYLPTTYAAVAFLACTPIGAIHSVVFAGFSAEALRDRINDCQSRVLITCDEGKINWTEGRDRWWDEEMAKVPNYCPPKVMSSEDPLFILYTSGSTGKPKGVVHTADGYALCGTSSTSIPACGRRRLDYRTYVHHLRPAPHRRDDAHVREHAHLPQPPRYWEVVAKHKLTQFYTALTVIRLLRRLGHHHVEGHDLSSLRVLGSVGEPINPEAWEWYNEHAGSRGECAIVDTWWQTETGSIVITPFPGAVPTKPGCATVPFFGHKPVILDSMTGEVKEGNGVEGVLALATPWPSIAHTIWRDHARYLETYMKPYPGLFYTGDGCRSRRGRVYLDQGAYRRRHQRLWAPDVDRGD
ncbi:Acetyl-coenzyme A synthetase [Mycena kentingensis (nom. inval.)]|nr:Acetyl-coenzyme A synthetase [Mycena kentingensis (nom. inval.)]